MLRMVVDRDLVTPTRNVLARRRDDVAAVGLDIETRAQRAGLALDEAARVHEQDVLAAAPSQEAPGRWQRAIIGFKLGKSFVAAVPGINVDDNQPGYSASGDADVTNRARPRLLDHREIGGRVIKSA